MNARSKPGFSIRAAVQVEDVPKKFKPGHVNPSKDVSPDGFVPEKYGWDPAGPDATEFRRCMWFKDAQPRQKYSLPETTYQDLGWIQSSPGPVEERTRRRKLRYGLGWQCKPPAEWSASSANPPLIGPPTSQDPNTLETVDEGAVTVLSATAPSRLSATPGSRISAAAPLSRVSAAAPLPEQEAAASQVSVSAPSALSALTFCSSSSLPPRSASLPALKPREVEALRLEHREKRAVKAYEECREYSNIGQRGHRWSRPLGMTDATSFQDNFCKATMGVPLYKFGRQT